MNLATRLKKFPFWSYVWFVLGVFYFVAPLLATFEFSLGMERDTISLKAYERAFADPKFRICLITDAAAFAITNIAINQLYFFYIRPAACCGFKSPVQKFSARSFDPRASQYSQNKHNVTPYILQ
mgnify:CR=1 FL=1